FYEKYYVPNNITFAIAGDVDPDEAKKLAKTYFGDIPSAQSPPPAKSEEPKQQEERRFVIEGQSQPFLMIGYHTVSAQHPDYKALELLGSVLAEGRTSLLYKNLVEGEKTMGGFRLFNGYPGKK